ncbi:winged helix DNA-binding domain-containing protein [Rubrobacter tropicus]|uniref:Winged helix DNA-binding domain-containing protein n=1 Tax=Rubrobacter tropicus TaxID=2653851 RepID=A0A6G8Q4P8_9ACTN|nr:winged helix DNA-binding domain-containing protein [Rubrobacter tropicus]QIN81399.1 winged helix DNA-binding domain-containing protein [Rubrobacter tropicus]
MTLRVLSLRELNRATLARQMLLERAEVSPYEAVRRLVGLQAQVPNPPYVGLWTRLRDFGRGDLTGLMERRRVVRAPLMRSTLHLMAAEDYLSLWPALQPALVRALNAFFGKRAKDVKIRRLVAAARDALDEAPRTMGELKRVLAEVEPGRDGDALNYAVRAHLPLVQVPPGGTWGSGAAAAYATAESRLGPPAPDPEAALRDLLFRYLAAFGPASVKDFQAWSGLVRLKGPVEEMKGELRLLRDERGGELLDLPDAPLPPPDALAPPRFVPEYDNLVLSHADRRRVIADEDRKKVFLSAARVRATFLLDGFVAGVWKIEKTKNAASLIVEPFAPLSTEDRDALAEDGERLLRFATDGEPEIDIHFAPPG